MRNSASRGADDDRRVRERLLQVGVAGDVIDVPVRADDGRERQAVVGERFADQVGLEAGVDDERLGAALAPDDGRSSRRTAATRW